MNINNIILLYNYMDRYIDTESNQQVENSMKNEDCQVNR